MSESNDEQPKTNLRLNWEDVHWFYQSALDSLQLHRTVQRTRSREDLARGPWWENCPKLVRFYGNDEKAGIGMRASLLVLGPKQRNLNLYPWFFKMYSLQLNKLKKHYVLSSPQKIYITSHSIQTSEKSCRKETLYQIMKKLHFNVATLWENMTSNWRDYFNNLLRAGVTLLQ